jgi:hypothetical protein
LRGCFSRSQFRPCAVSRAIVGLVVVTAGGQPSAQAVVPRPLGAGLVVNRPATDADPKSPPTASVENPTGRISLRDALALALRQSPELASYGWEIRARESAAIQAGQPSNPVLEVLLEDLWATGARLKRAAPRSRKPPSSSVSCSSWEANGRPVDGLGLSGREIMTEAHNDDQG